jgi:tetratricopeptide (TPR) repeat protein
MASNLLEENLRTYKDNPQLSGAYAPESLFLMDAPVAGSRSGDELALKVALQAMADGVASISHIRLVVENRMAQKEFDEAERYIKQGYLLSEKRPQEINRLDIDKLQKDYALTKAEHLAKTALENGDDSFDNYRIRAEIAILKEEPASALDLLETVPARFRSLPGYLNLLGVTRFHQEHYEAALQLFQQALQVDSTFGKAYYNLALVYSELGEKEKARENFEKYKSLEKDERWMRIADSQIR